MKRLLWTTLFILGLANSILATDLPVKNQDVSPEQLAKQNKQIIQMVAQELMKTIPQKINKYTSIVDVKAVESNLIYSYEINTGAKSDEAVMAEDRTNWEAAFIENECKRSQRFLDAQVKISHVYNSEKTKVKLFQFDVTQAKCYKLFGPR
ncbi:MAG: hypothetical protein U9N30_04140 [Campylobacterota bacterium]|nr:hypothetical protein [Campylobacterota bacterium]